MTHYHPRVQASAKVIDLFCGIGGLTHGLVLENFDVVAGIDNDESCRYGYEYNNETARFINRDVLEVSSEEVGRLFGSDNGLVRVLVGCAPCQQYSKLNPNRLARESVQPLQKFASIIRDVKPEVVSMENVPELTNTEKFPIFTEFISSLSPDYFVTFEVVDVSEYGVPQARRRLVLLASRLGPINLIDRTHKDEKVNVRKAIEHLSPIKAGEISESDSLHRARKLSPLNMARIRATPHDGGTMENWSEDLLLECHKRKSGRSYRSVYGRMFWDQPAPTMTTHCIGYGNGRFGHPEQNRGISLREAAIFQSFPWSYRFMDPTQPLVVNRVAKFIGNAVPVDLARVIGISINNHLENYAKL